MRRSASLLVALFAPLVALLCLATHVALPVAAAEHAAGGELKLKAEAQAEARNLKAFGGEHKMMEEQAAAKAKEQQQLELGALNLDSNGPTLAQIAAEQEKERPLATLGHPIFLGGALIGFMWVGMLTCAMCALCGLQTPLRFEEKGLQLNKEF